MDLENNTINWKVISESVDFYKNRGYTYLEVPWYVTEEAIKKTLPIKEYAEVIREINKPKICPFRDKIPENKLWEIVRSLI